MIANNVFKIIFVFFILISTTKANQSIATINLDRIFQNSNDFTIFLENLKLIKNDYDTKFKFKESELIEQKKIISDSESILNQEEINKLIADYTIEVNNFSTEVKNYNEKVDLIIEGNKDIILAKILEILKEISIKNQYDIILSEDNYFIASDNIDISEIVIKKLNSISTELKTNLE